jgi:phosphate transport system substrate-binding protein
MVPLLEDLSQAFNAQHPDVAFEIQDGNTALGLDLLAKGEVELAAASWLPSDLPVAWVTTPIAWDGLAIIVHPSNPLEGLTILQLRRIFAGWASHWQEVGVFLAANEDPPEIQVISREDGSGTRAVFERQVMGNERVTFNALVIPTSWAVVDYIAEHENAIGYVSMAWTDDRVKVLRIEGIFPAPEAVRSGYHLAYPLYLVTRDQPAGAIKAFLDFALSPAGQAIVSRRYGRIR